VASVFSCVAFSGSRRLLPSVSLRCAASVLSVFSPSVLSAGGAFAVGCCPSGLDLNVRCLAASVQSTPLRLFSVVGERSASALRARTLRMVAACSCLFVFPISVNFRSSGSWLCAFAAARRGVPVFVFLPSASLSSLPCVGGVASWRVVKGESLPCPVPGFNFFSPVLSAKQVELF